jgi:hypothetical protein
MTDLRARFQRLDDLEAPNLWPEIESRATVVRPGSDSSRLWALVAVAALLVAAIGGTALVASGAIELPFPRSLPESSAAPDQTAAPAWIATGSMVTPRSGGHSATLLAGGTVLVAGGAAGQAGNDPLASAELLNPATLTWTSIGDMAQGRSGHTATLLPDGTVLISGGSDPNGHGPSLRTAEVYDPARGIWTATAEMTETRTGHTATLLPDGRVLVAGGHNGGPFLDTAELYDPATRTWTAMPAMTQGRASQTATLLSDGTVLVAGGVDGNDGGPCCTPLSSAELFDPRTGSWAATESMIELRGGSTATLLPDGRVFVAGMINEGLVPTGELYDPGTGSWTPTRNMIEPRDNFTATLLPDGRVLVAGGGHGFFTGVATSELYDPRTGSWARTRTMNASGRGGQVAIGLADGRVLLVGGVVSMEGSDGPMVLSDPAAEIFDPEGGG